uniref:Uncharacterized protein n=1 Tax=Anguilla anguilla TaxID=7936 RepID=A0A0E9QA73_ANGAN
MIRQRPCYFDWARGHLFISTISVIPPFRA